MAGSLSPCLGGTHPGVSAHWHLQSPGPWTRASSGTRSRPCWSLWFCSSLLCCSPSRPGGGLPAPKNLPKKQICTFKQGEGIVQHLFPRRKDALCWGLNHQTHLLKLSGFLLCLQRGHKTPGRGRLLPQLHQSSPLQFSCLAFSPKVYAKGFWKQTWIQKQIQVCPISNGSWLCHKNRIHNYGEYLRPSLQKNWAAQKKERQCESTPGLSDIYKIRALPSAHTDNTSHIQNITSGSGSLWAAECQRLEQAREVALHACWVLQLFSWCCITLHEPLIPAVNWFLI